MNKPQTGSFKHELKIQVRFSDLDVMGHVNNAVYISYFELAKAKYFDQVFSQPVNWKETALITANNTVDYYAPVFLYSQVKVLSRIRKLGNKSLHMEQLMVDQQLQVKARIISVLVAYDIPRRESVELPGSWRTDIASYEDWPSPSSK
jgi:acyl-CoA thioester hydrolase